MKQYRLNMNAGFTLVEVIIAMGILAIGIVAVVSLMSRTLVLDEDAVTEVTASNYARERMEKIVEMQGLSYAAVKTKYIGGYEFLDDVNGFTGRAYIADITLFDLGNGSSIDKCFNLCVEVNWQDRLGTARTTRNSRKFYNLAEIDAALKEIRKP